MNNKFEKQGTGIYKIKNMVEGKFVENKEKDVGTTYSLVQAN